MSTMIKISLCALISAVLFAGCAGYEKAASDNKAMSNANAANTANTNAAPASAAVPTKETLAGLEKQAFEAWSKKDTKYFEGFLSPNSIGMGEKGEPISRADIIKMIGQSNCVVKSYSFSDERVTPVGADAAVITMTVDADYTCGGQKGPSPVRSASVYVRDGNAWKGAYHNEVPIIDPKNMKAEASKPGPPPAKSEATASDPLTEALLAVEKRGWEGWKNRDANTLNQTTAKDVTFVDLFGNVTIGQADVVKNWTDGSCDVKSVSVTDAKAIQLTKDAAILTYKGSGDGKCNDMAVRPVRGTTIAIKDGDTWKAVYIFETPA
jgi:ketosteroid isomerase-like protein